MVRIEEMWLHVEPEMTRVLAFRKRNLRDALRTRLCDDTLHVAEFSLAPGQRSRVENAPAAGWC
jgi:hypothetical protein